MKTASWIIRNKETKEVVMETFSGDLAAAVNADKYEAVPILQYLQEVNRDLKLAAEKTGR